MTFEEFRKWQRVIEAMAIERIEEGRLPTWHNERGRAPWFYAIAVAGETGEMLEATKKALRRSEDMSAVPEEDRLKIILEAGDALHYLSQFLDSIGSSLEDCAQRHQEHVNERLWRDTIKEQEES
jgi:NTP pyrophosphatase (non-canonical NTP hydrolase)